MINIKDDILGVIYNIFGSDSRNHSKSTSQISYNCPVCDDNKGNLEINYNKLVMKCWKCCDDDGGLKGPLRSLIKKYGTQRDLKFYDEITENYKIDFNFEKPKFIENYKSKIKLPKEFILIKTAYRDAGFYEAYNYLRSRGLDDEMIYKHDLGYCIEGKYAGRIILPSYDKDGDLNYFVARSYVGHKQTYDNPVVAKSEIIVNQLNINWDSTVYLVEGFFDLIGLGIDNCIPLLGKIMSEKLYYEIVRKAKGFIFICLDPDAKKYAYRIYQRLQHTKELHDKVMVIDLPKSVTINGEEEKLDIAKIRELYGEKGVLKYIKKARMLVLEDFIKNGL